MEAYEYFDEVPVLFDALVDDERTEPNNPIGYYFLRARDLERLEPLIPHMTHEGMRGYLAELRTTYDVLYDRIVRSPISRCLKQETEQWFSFNRDFLGFGDTNQLNNELEDMLRRFYLL